MHDDINPVLQINPVKTKELSQHIQRNNDYNFETPEGNSKSEINKSKVQSRGVLRHGEV